MIKLTNGGERGSSERLTICLLRCGMVGSIMFVIVFLVDGATRIGYDPIYHPVSALSLGDRGWIQVVNFIIAGLLMIAFAVGLRRALFPGHGAKWGPLLFGLFGLSLLFSGVFVMDPMKGYPPGAPSGVYSDGTSWHHTVHDAFGIVVFTSLPIACFVIARRFTKSARRSWSIYSTLTGFVMIVLFFIFGTLWESDSPFSGLIQRIMLIVGFLWTTLVAIYLIKRLKKESERDGRQI
ncbi:DUF998 domain-containing protein [Evansella halocellulosilytica]|uniref:DUF998 domain-containing protein n=1 Tax=Evansella halocellulosilytica TaxID=2011013 RepID=UPI001C534C89|nr:DUF998 domain-containing protein [Evansella halocellulosilytica]